MGQLDDTAIMVRMEVSDHQIVDLLHPRIARRRHDAVCIACLRGIAGNRIRLALAGVPGIDEK